MDKNARLLAAALAATALLAACGGDSDRELTASAQTFLDKGDTKSATLQLKSALQKNGQNAQARYLLGSALLAAGDPVAAAVELRKARELKYDDNKTAPALARALLQHNEARKLVDEFAATELSDAAARADLKTTLGMAYAVLDDKDKARESFKAAQQAVPAYAPASVASAKLKASEGDIDGAIFLLDDVLAKNAKDDSALLLKGDLLAYSKKDTEGAMQAWRAALAARPNLLAAHVDIIGTALRENKPEVARAQLAELKKFHPNHVETRFYQAQLAYMDKDYKATRELTEQVLKITPDNPLALQLAGAAEFQLKSLLPAETYFTRALKIQPSLGLARVMLAQTYLRSGQPNKAVELMEPVVAAPDADPRLVALAAEAALQAGDTKKSEALYARAAKSGDPDPKLRAALALRQADRGNDKALLDLQNIAAADTGTRTDLALIAARLGRKDLDGALKAIDALQKKLPDKPLAYQLRGRVLMLKNDDKGAVASFEKALSFDPVYFPAVSSLAALDLKAGQPDRARQRFDELLKVDPKNYQALLALAELKARAGGSKQDVAALIGQAVKLNPGEPTPRLLLMRHLLAYGDGKAALAAAQDATAALPDNLDVMEGLGQAQIAAGQPQQAVTTFKKLAALQPTRAQPQIRLADAYMASRDAEGATAAYRRALEINPKLIGAQRALVRLAVADRKPLDAEIVARKVQEQRPTEGIGWMLQGDVELARKNWDAAFAAYRTALQKTKDTETAAHLHTALTEAGRADEADRFAAGWLADHPKDAVFIFHQGDLLTARQQWAAAETRYRKVLELQPDSALAYNNIAWLLLKQNKPGAVAAAEKANSLLPDRPPLQDTLALALLAENQAPKALEVQKRALENAPEDPTLMLTLARIYLKTGDKSSARAQLEKLSKLGSRFGGQAEVTELLKSV